MYLSLRFGLSTIMLLRLVCTLAMLDAIPLLNASLPRSISGFTPVIIALHLFTCADNSVSLVMFKSKLDINSSLAIEGVTGTTGQILTFREHLHLFGLYLHVVLLPLMIYLVELCKDILYKVYCLLHSGTKLTGSIRNVNKISTYEYLRGTGVD